MGERVPKWLRDGNPFGPNYDANPRVMGVGRDPNNHKFVDVAFTRPLTDDQLRDLHGFLRGWRP